MDRIITKRPKERRCNADSDQLPQLLDSPLPTPRRSCASTDSPSLRRRASPLRTQVPFSWESSPGVPKKSSRDMRKADDQEMMPPPKLPPGRWPTCPSRTWCYGNSSEASTDDDDDASFSDALDRISSPERTGSFDRITSKRFEDIFLGRATSFAKDRSGSGHARAAGDGAIIAPSSSGRHAMSWRQRSTRRDQGAVERPTIRQSGEAQLLPRINFDARVEQMSPRACGLMVFFPWSPRPAVYGFRSPVQYDATPRGGAGDPSPSQSRRISTTLRDAIQEENKTDGGQDLPQQPRREKRGRDREECQQGRGWGVSSLLGTSKRYCTDARKALGKLSIGLGSDSGSPRVGRARKHGHHDVSTMPSIAAKLKRLNTNTRN